VVADYFAVQQLWQDHRTAADAADAARLALSAGLDVELPAMDCFQHLPELVRTGQLAESVIDTAAERVLVQKFRLGLFERPLVEPPARASYDTPVHRGLARRAAGRAVCLLSNDGVLPLDSGLLSRVAVIGPHADDIRLLQGDYHYPAHLEIIYGADVASDGPDRSGLPTEGGSFRPGPHFTPHVTPLDGLRAALGPSVEIEHVRGCHVSDPDDVDLPAATGAARRADVAVVCVGGHSGLLPHSTVGEMRDSATLELSGAQADLVEAVCATGTPTVVVVVSGRVHVLGRVADAANALLWSAPPGEEGGNALADVLTGTVAPSGRLPVSLPRTVGQLPVHHDQRSRGDTAAIWGAYTDSPVSPLFAFGHGLSYTTFAYGSLEVDAGSTVLPTTVSVDVANNGARGGEEVVQLYVRDEVASVARPNLELIGFARVDLDPGASASVTFTVHPSRLAFHDSSVSCVTEPGDFTFLVGAGSDDIRSRATVHLDGEVTGHPLRHRIPTSVSVSPVGAPG